MFCAEIFVVLMLGSVVTVGLVIKTSYIEGFSAFGGCHSDHRIDMS